MQDAMALHLFQFSSDGEIVIFLIKSAGISQIYINLSSNSKSTHSVFTFNNFKRILCLNLKKL